MYANCLGVKSFNFLYTTLSRRYCIYACKRNDVRCAKVSSVRQLSGREVIQFPLHYLTLGAHSNTYFIYLIRSFALRFRYIGKKGRRRRKIRLKIIFCSSYSGISDISQRSTPLYIGDSTLSLASWVLRRITMTTARLRITGAMTSETT